MRTPEDKYDQLIFHLWPIISSPIDSFVLALDKKYHLLVFTKATDIHIRELWLAPVARDIQDY